MSSSSTSSFSLSLVLGSFRRTKRARTDSVSFSSFCSCFAELEIGDEMEVKGPAGHFEWTGQGMTDWHGIKRKYKNIGMVCGGSGEFLLLSESSVFLQALLLIVGEEARKEEGRGSERNDTRRDEELTRRVFAFVPIRNHSHPSSPPSHLRRRSRYGDQDLDR